MPFNKKRLIFVDLETSGLEPMEGAVILAIGAVVEVPGKGHEGELSEFNCYIKPTEMQWKNAKKEALEVNGITWEYLEEHGVTFEEARELFLSWLAKNKVESGRVIYVGQNPAFDQKFLHYWMGIELDFMGFPSSEDEIFDIRKLYSILASRSVVPYLKNRNGHAISEALGVEQEPKPHQAIEGARVVKRNYDKIVELGVYNKYP